MEDAAGRSGSLWGADCGGWAGFGGTISGFLEDSCLGFVCSVFFTAEEARSCCGMEGGVFCWAAEETDCPVSCFCPQYLQNFTPSGNSFWQWIHFIYLPHLSDNSLSYPENTYVLAEKGPR